MPCAERAKRVKCGQAQALWGPYYFATPASREREREALLDALPPDDHINTLPGRLMSTPRRKSSASARSATTWRCCNAKAGRTNEAMTDLQALRRKLPRTGRSGSLRQAVLATLKQLRSR